MAPPLEVKVRRIHTKANDQATRRSSSQSAGPLRDSAKLEIEPVRTLAAPTVERQMSPGSPQAKTRSEKRKISILK